MESLSVFVITFNNARTLPACLESVKWADEIVVLDSLSTDGTLDVARDYGARIYEHTFMGFGKQKQMALAKTSHDWVLLLDADEALSPELQTEIHELLERGPDAAGYALPRQEQLFWRMANPHARRRPFMRLFDKRKGGMSDKPIHSAPEVEGRVGRLKHPFYHYGLTHLEAKMDKINRYSSSLVEDKLARGRRGNPLMMVFYPPFYFVKQYVVTGNFLNGWVGFMLAAVDGIYVFLKYAKLYEHFQFEKNARGAMPDGAPPLERPRTGRPA